MLINQIHIFLRHYFRFTWERLPSRNIRSLDACRCCWTKAGSPLTSPTSSQSASRPTGRKSGLRLNKRCLWTSSSGVDTFSDSRDTMSLADMKCWFNIMYYLKMLEDRVEDSPMKNSRIKRRRFCVVNFFSSLPHEIVSLTKSRTEIWNLRRKKICPNSKLFDSLQQDTLKTHLWVPSVECLLSSYVLKSVGRIFWSSYFRLTVRIGKRKFI